jgi:hypothetical protein
VEYQLAKQLLSRQQAGFGKGPYRAIKNVTQGGAVAPFTM